MALTLYDSVKRLADIVMSAVALVISTPLWLWAGLAIILTDGWPFLYSQSRVGRGGRIYYILKFRSMIKQAEAYSGPVLAEENDPRITRVGRILRKTALDEIPQIVSIFKGDMSWVGPRPERPEFVRQFLEEIPGYALRYQVRPGLTGVAQVYGRYYTEAAEKLKYDLYYLQHRGLVLDFNLFIKSWLITGKGRWDSSAEKR